MSRSSVIALIVASSCLLGNSSCPLTQPLPGDGQQNPTLALFDELWQTFDENYSYFEYKDIDWDDVHDRYQPNFNQTLTGDQFVDELLPLLGELHDWHIEVMRPDGTWVGTNPRTFTENYPHTPRNRYLAGGASYQVLGDNVVRHAWFADNIAYIRVDTFSTEAFESITDQEIENLFATYAAADGMIFDIRPNNGGDENMAARFTSRFTNQAVTFGYTETRNGPNHDDFDPLAEKALTPSAGTKFLGPTACLIGQKCLSSAEWCTLMMRACPNVVLFGDRTRGGSGFPRTFELTNGVQYKVSRWVAYTDELTIFEDVGIPPAVAVTTGESHGFDGEHDYVIEAAVDWLATP